MTSRPFTVTVGSLELTARAEVIGKFRPAVTQADPEYCHPEESPEVDVHTLTVGATDVTGLLDYDDILESIYEQILEQLDEAERERDPDAYDKWRDEQMERNA